MKKKVLQTILSLACVASCALGFAACDLFGGGDDGDGEKEQYAVYHLNGGHIGDSDDTEEYRQYLHEDTARKFKPLKAKRETWVFENWYFNEELTEAYSDQRFEELRAQQDEVNFYAKWIDEITVNKENFTDFFEVSSRWNGATTIGFAGIRYSISPIVAFDPENSAESFDVEVSPILTNNGSVVWNGEKSIETLTAETDYSCERLKKIDSSGAEIEFDVHGRTLDYELKTESFVMKLMHKVPIEITLELDGGECESGTLTVIGSEELSKDSLPTPQKSGYRFIGWYTDEAFETEYEDWLVTRPRTLYAKFKKEVTVTFHPNGGTEKEASTLLSGDLINPYTPQREDYEFMGWYTDPSFEHKLKSGATAAEEDLDLYAKWLKIHTITFETNGGTAIEAMRVVDGETPDLYTANPTKSGVEFLGWYTDPACETKYEEGSIHGDLTLYAYWARGIKLHNPTIEELKQYLNIELTDEYTTETKNGLIYNVRKFKLTASIKNEYLRPGLTIYDGEIQINFKLENNRDGGWYYFDHFTLSTQSGELTYEGEYSVREGYSGYEETTTWKLIPYLSCTVYSPEETDVN